MNYQMKLGQEDLKQVSDLHFDLLGAGFLATFGSDFLYLLYKEIYESKSAVLILAKKGNRVIGFIAGGLGLRHIYLGLLRSPLKLIVTLAPKLINRWIFIQLGSLILRSKKVTYTINQQTTAELYSICVAKDYQGTGTADELYMQLSQHFADNNIDEFLIFVGEKLARAQSFYIKKGAFRVGKLDQGAGKLSLILCQKTN